MLGDDLPKLKLESLFPRNIEDLSVSDLGEYVIELQEEITRVELDIISKKASKDAAASFFK